MKKYISWNVNGLRACIKKECFYEFIRQEDLETITTEADLADRTIVAQSGSLQEAQAARSVQYYKEFHRVSSVQGIYELVRSGKADAGFVDMETAQHYIAANKDAGLALVDNLYFTLEEQELGDRICAKKGELQLMYFVNGVIDEVLENGQYMKWIEDAEKRASELGL